MNRINSIDFTRGFVMIIMALDHTRDLMHSTALDQNPLNLDTTTPALFFTRWITHICAPAFVFLAGASANIFLSRQENQAAARNFLIKRGIWLIILEFTIILFGLTFDLKFRLLAFLVVATIGSGLILVSLFSRLSTKWIALIAAMIIFGHNLLPQSVQGNGSLNFIYSLLFRQGLFPMGEGRFFLVAYPIIPWLGIMLLGYSCARYIQAGSVSSRKQLLKLSIGMFIMFLLIRYVNEYGDPIPWAARNQSLFTFLSFINANKNPPSLVFTFMTLSMVVLILFLSYNIKGKLAAIVSVYGRSPLFYFIVHFYIIHVATLIMLLIQGFSWDQLSFEPFRYGRPTDVQSGIGLGAIYIAWICVVLLMYPLCKWYEAFKKRHSEWTWLKYF